MSIRDKVFIYFLGFVLWFVASCGLQSDKKQRFIFNGLNSNADSVLVLKKLDSLYKNQSLNPTQFPDYFALKLKIDKDYDSIDKQLLINIDTLNHITITEKNAAQFLEIYRELSFVAIQSNNCEEGVKYGYKCLEAFDKIDKSENKNASNNAVDYLRMATAYRQCGDNNKYKLMIDGCLAQKPDSHYTALAYND